MSWTGSASMGSRSVLGHMLGAYPGNARSSNVYYERLQLRLNIEGVSATAQVLCEPRTGLSMTEAEARSKASVEALCAFSLSSVLQSWPPNGEHASSRAPL